MSQNVHAIFVDNLPMALSFGAPGLAIAGIFLASIPIIIHFLNRRRYKTHRWAAMQYLLEALRRNRRRLKFENFLLLAMRCAAVLLVAVALARPLGCGSSAAARMVGQTTRLHVIVLDNSASMSFQIDETDARTCLERAKRHAGELISRLSSSHDAVAIIPAAAASHLSALAPTYDLAAATEALGAIPQRFQATDLPGALRRALEIGQGETAFTGRRLYILTDSTLPAWQDEAVAEDLRQLGPALASVFDVVHIDAGEATAANAGITQLRMLASVATTSMGVDFAATPFAHSTAQAALIWQNAGQVLASSGTLQLSSAHPEQTLPGVQFTRDGPTAITVRLEPSDRMPADDQRSIAFDVRRRLEVIIGEGDRGTTSLQSPGTFLQMALSPSGAETESVKVDVIGDQEVGSRPLVGRDAVILAAPAGISPSDAVQVRQYVEAGGTLIVFMGEGVNPDVCNRVLLAERLLPGRLVGLTALAEGQEPFQLDFRPDASLHPLLRVFRGVQNSGLSTTRVWTYGRVELDESLSPQRVLDFVGGDPAITLHNLGRGRVVFFATSADTRWTTLPAKPAFVALIHEILLGTVNAGSSWMNIRAGDRLEIPRRILQAGQPVLSEPTGQAVSLEPSDGTSPDAAFVSVPLERPGLYRLQVGTQSYPISVSFPAVESDLTHIEPAAISRALGDIDIRHEQNRMPAELVSTTDRSDFSWPLLLLATMVLGAESLLARWFSR